MRSIVASRNWRKRSLDNPSSRTDAGEDAILSSPVFSPESPSVLQSEVAEEIRARKSLTD